MVVQYSEMYTRTMVALAACLLLAFGCITEVGKRARVSQRVVLTRILESSEGVHTVTNSERLHTDTSSKGVNSVVRRAVSRGGGSVRDGKKGWVEELAGMSPPVKLSRTEEARCKGLLRSCQTWLELKDGTVNHIVITAPDDDTKSLIDKNVTLPQSGKHIDGAIWSVLQDSCKFGLADLRTCDKPDHWPKCTGQDCNKA